MVQDSLSPRRIMKGSCSIVVGEGVSKIGRCGRDDVGHKTTLLDKSVVKRRVLMRWGDMAAVRVPAAGQDRAV